MMAERLLLDAELTLEFYACAKTFGNVAAWKLIQAKQRSGKRSVFVSTDFHSHAVTVINLVNLPRRSSR